MQTINEEKLKCKNILMRVIYVSVFVYLFLLHATCKKYCVYFPKTKTKYIP